MRYLFSILGWLMVTVCFGQASTDEFQKGNEAYRNSNFEEAIYSYQSILEEGKQSAALFYNLGNAYFKTGQIAKAILNYERALRLQPGDGEILQNLELARESVIDDFEKMPQPLFKAFFTKLIKLLPPGGWAWLTVVFALLIAGGGFLYLFTAFKRPGFIAAVVGIIFCGLSWFFAQRHYSILQNNKEAIVMTASSYVKSGPGEKAEDVFILHAGTKATVNESYGGWSKIQLPDGKIGWIHSGDLEVI